MLDAADAKSAAVIAGDGRGVGGRHHQVDDFRLALLGAIDGLARTIASALAVAALLLVGFYIAQRSAGQRLLQWIMNTLAGDRQWRVLGTIDAVYEQLATIYAGQRRLFLSSLVHMVSWLVGVAEVLIVFAWMGHPIGTARRP
jgi:hypothetical protein